MLVYRIDRQRRSDQLLTGKGAEIFGGRWNYPGTPVIYTASSRSLAILEVMVHMSWQEHLPDDRIMVTLEIPEHSVYTLDTGSLGAHWSDFPYHNDSQKVFEAFRSGRSRDSIALQVPSAIVPQEHNYCLDPSAASDLVKVIGWEKWHLDGRFKNLYFPV